MKNSAGSNKTRSLISICVMLVVIACMPLLASGRVMATSLTIVNNSSRDIRNVYLSHVDADDWSDNLLGDAIIAAGHTNNLNISGCDGQQMKVIGEDSEGCFVTLVINCGSSSTWTIVDDTARDCGSSSF